MKKIIVVLFAVIILASCTGINQDVTWNPSKTYALYDTAFIPSNGQYAYEEYLSIRGDNTGNYPPDSPSYWIDCHDVPADGVISRGLQ